MNKPKIRFKGFNDDWEQRKVSELADDIYGGGTPKTSVEEYWNGTIPWIQSSDITEHDVNSINPKKFISDRAVNKSATKLVPENSIAIVTRVGVGKLVIMPFSYTTSQDFLSLSKLNSDLPFTAYLLYKKMQDELHSVQGTSIKGITKEELLSKEVMITQIEEQKKIGTYFSELDHLITLHQRKIIFYAHFYTIVWEQRKLEELCNITTGRLDANAMVLDGQYDFYTSGIDVFKIDKAAFEGPAITIAGNGASVGYMHLADGKFNAYQRTYVLTDFSADRQFLNVAIGNMLPDKIQEEVRGSGIPYIVLNMLTDLVIPFPSQKEQATIGAYFEGLDHLITLHQWKCRFLVENEVNDWEQRKLFDIANKVTEKNKNNEFSEPFTNSAEQGIVSQREYFDREIVNNENLDGYYIVRNNDFIYNPRVSVTAPVGPINRNRLGRNGVMSPLYTIFRTHNIDNLFLEFYFKTTSWHRYMKLNGDSGARFDRFTISSVQFMKMPIPYPMLAEQKKIGEYLDNLDHLITLHQRKCEELKNMKKFMLQNMFV